MNLLEQRNRKGDIPIHWPFLILLYLMLFLLCFDFVMLFWLKTSLTSVARQIAIRAATINNNNSELDLSNMAALNRAIRTRCLQAGQNLGSFGPGYSNRVREQFLAALRLQPTDSGWLAQINNETAQNGAEIRDHPAVQNPAGINLSPRATFFEPTNAADHNRCFAVINENNQVTFHVNIHCDNCWPVLSRFVGLSGYLEGRGSHVVLHSGTVSNISAVNKSLESMAVRPTINLAGTFSREAVSENAWRIGFNDFAVDQGLNLNSRTSTNNSISISLRNEGELDFLTILGIRIAMSATDTFGNILNSINSNFEVANRKRYLGLPQDFLSLEFQGRPALEFREEALLSESEGGIAQVSVSNLDGNGGALIIRNSNPDSQRVFARCNTSMPAETQTPTPPAVYTENSEVWYGPYYREGFRSQADFSRLESLHKSVLEERNEASNLFNPVDLLMPYYAVCSVCGSKSPRAGLFGRCKSNPTVRESVVTNRLEWWNNSSYNSLNPLYTEIQCRYRRNCREAHCCSSVPRTELEDFCRNREIRNGDIRSRTCSRTIYFQEEYDEESNDITPAPKTLTRESVWRYQGRPNLENNFPDCSNSSDNQSECCTVKMIRVEKDECSNFCKLSSNHPTFTSKGKVKTVSNCSAPFPPVLAALDLLGGKSYQSFRRKRCQGRYCFVDANKSPNNGSHGYLD